MQKKTGIMKSGVDATPLFLQDDLLKPIHFIDKMKLMLIPQARNSTTHLTLVCSWTDFLMENNDCQASSNLLEAKTPVSVSD